MSRLRFGQPKIIERYKHYPLIVDGKPFSLEEGYAFQLSKDYFVYAYSRGLIKALSAVSVADLNSLAHAWSFQDIRDWGFLALDCEVSFDDARSWKKGDSATFKFDSENWRAPWSIADFGSACEKLGPLVLPEGWHVEPDEEFTSNGIKVFFPKPQGSENIGVLLLRVATQIDALHEAIRLRLLAEVNPDSIVALFDFPKETRAVLTQYLIYLDEFLSLLGIKAQSTIGVEAQKVLLTVTPEEGKTVLAATRAALAVYLQLPTGHLSRDDAMNSDSKIRALTAAIAYCQLQLGRLPITVSASASDVASGGKVQNKASFFGGRLAVGKLTKGPLEIDLPRIIRELTARFPVLRRLR